MKDIIIKCKNCDQDFVWTVDEQIFSGKNRIDKPDYCMICRGMMEKASEDDFRGKMGK